MSRGDDAYRRRDGVGETPRAAPAQNPFWWLRDRDALLRRFVLSQAVGEPRCRAPFFRRRPGGGGR